MSKVFSSECKMCSFCGVGLPTTDVAAWKKTEEEKLLHSLLNHFLTTLFAFSKNCHSFKSRNDASRFEMEGKNRKGNNLTVSVKIFGNFFLKKISVAFLVEWWSLKSVPEKKRSAIRGLDGRQICIGTKVWGLAPHQPFKCQFGRKLLKMLVLQNNRRKLA